MTRRFFSVRRAASRKALLAATVLSLCPMIGGCVSAVDESNAFGFSQTPEPKSIEEAIRQEGSSAEKPAGETEASTVASNEAAEAGASDKKVAALTSPTRAAEVAQTQTPAADGASAAAAAETGTITPGSFLTRASSPSVAAFAEPKKNLEADRSLYASLYNQAQAKTPLRNAEAGKSGRVIVHQRTDDSVDIGANALPGVDPKSLFEIGQRASVDSELIDDIGSSYQLASLSGIARLAPSGLLIQREDVVTNCFDSNLMNLIGQIERRFNQKVVITSGFRSPSHNRRVNGAKASMHMACKAADLHVPGVNGLEVARFVRGLPGRGGVGTYCHTAAIHIDVGKMRDWNWPCRRRQST